MWCPCRAGAPWSSSGQAGCRVIEPGGTLRAAPAYADAAANKFLGMVKSPGYATNHFVYLYVSYWAGGSGSANPNANRVVRLIDDGTDLTFDRTDLRRGDPQRRQPRRRPDGLRARRQALRDHGDVHDRTLPQDKNSLNGKILRLEAPGDDTDGQPAARQPVPRARTAALTSGAMDTAIRRASPGTPRAGCGRPSMVPVRRGATPSAGRRDRPRRDQPHRAGAQLRLAH